MAKKRFTTTIQDINIANGKIPRLVKNISDIGIDFSLIARKNSLSVSNEDRELYDTFLAVSGDGLVENEIPYFDKRWDDKLTYLTDFSANTEIEFILHSICDEAIVYDKFGYFCNIDTKDLTLNEDIKQNVQNNFKKIYSMYGWDDGIKAWETFLKFLIEGFDTYEIVFQYKTREEIEKIKKEKEKRIAQLIDKGNAEDKNNKEKVSEWLNEQKRAKRELETFNEKLDLLKDIFKTTKNNKFFDQHSSKHKMLTEDLVPFNILGFIPIKSNRVIPLYHTDRETGKQYKFWKVFKEDSPAEYTVFSDFQIVQINYSKVAGNTKRLSYTERLIRNYNLTRKLEESRVAWNIMNSQFRMKMIFPIGTKVSAKSKQILRQVADRHKEELVINSSSGEVTINGNPQLPYGRNIVLPSRQGNTPEVDGVAYNGPDLSNMDVVEYFRKNLWRDSIMPQSRFDRSGSAGALVLFRADGVPYDEISFHNFLDRLRKEYEKLIKKPLYIQCLLDFPELKIDREFKLKIGVSYNTTSYFEEAKQAEIDSAKLNNISTLASAMMPDGSTPIYSLKYLYVDKFKLLTEEEWEMNRRLVSEEMKKNEEGGEGGGLAGLGI